MQLELQAERAEREALARQVQRLKDELDHVKGLVATVLESSPNIQQNQTAPSQSQLPIQTPIVDLPSSPSKAVKRGKDAKRGKAAKKKAKVAVVDLTSSPSKRDNAGEAVTAVVDLVSSPSKGATSVTYTRAKIRAHKNLMIVAPQSNPQSEPVRNEVRVLCNDKLLKKHYEWHMKITYELTLCTPYVVALCWVHMSFNFMLG